MGITKIKLKKEELVKIVAATFPECTLADYEELTEGLCNTAYRMVLSNGQKVVLKVTSGNNKGFMSNESGMMDAEVSAMNIVAEQTDIRVAKVYRYDTSREIIDGNYFLMESLDGDSWFSRKESLSDEVNQSLSRETGCVQKKLAGIRSDHFGMLGDKEHSFSNQYDFLKYLITNVVNDARAVHVEFGVSYDEITEALEKDKELFLEIRTPSLVHWDMWEGNIFIKNNKLAGIIDWERAMWADPMMDDRFRFHTRNQAFLDGFGITELSGAEERRILWYDVFLYLTMMTEPTYREYEDDGQYNWIQPLFMKVWEKLFQ